MEKTIPSQYTIDKIKQFMAKQSVRDVERMYNQFFRHRIQWSAKRQQFEGMFWDYTFEPKTLKEVSAAVENAFLYKEDL